MKNKLIKYYVSLAIAFAMVFSFGFSTLAAEPDHDVIDLSHHNYSSQGLPASFFQVTRAYGVKAIVQKVSEGTTVRDSSASTNIALARKIGMQVNVYHYAHLSSISEAKQEADWFYKNAIYAGYNPKTDGYMALDLEATNLSNNQSTLTSYANAFFKQLESHGVYKYDLYSGSYYYNTRLQPKNLPYAVWLASYPYTPNRDNITAKFTNGRGMWQWTSGFLFPGLSKFGRFDVSADYYGKYIIRASLNNTVKKVGSVSLINYLSSKKIDNSFTNRAKLAVKYGIVDKVSLYHGESQQNISLLLKIKSGAPKVSKPKALTIKQRNPSQYLPKNTKKITTRLTVYLYNSTSFTTSHRVAKFKKNTTFTIKSSKLSANGTLRFVTKSGKYISANKKYVRIYFVKPQAKKIVKKVAHKTYRVVKGDTLWEISKAKNVSVSKLKKLNHLRSDLINIGQVLKLK
jgi:GH25 family lysozyme M1 (1,4-beta-N-acetylmuramidase)/LysM repeat protein